MKKGLSEKQMKAIRALVDYPTIKEAAEATGISERSVERWRTQPEFQDTLHQIQYDWFKDAGVGMILSMKKAQESLVDVMENPIQPGANMKLKAAKLILDMGSRFQKQAEIDGRIKKLEEKAGISDATRIGMMEDYFCRKIVEDYRESNPYEHIAPFTKLELEVFERIVEDAPNKIYLLSEEERIKYDQAYADKWKVDFLRAKQEEIRSSRHKLPKNGQNHEEKKKNLGKPYYPSGSPKTIAIKERPKGPLPEPENEKVDLSHEEKTGHVSSLSDEDIMKWDPDNYDRIRQIERENDLKIKRGETYC